MKQKVKCSKKTGIALFWTVAVILAAIIVVHDNQLADPQDELVKKIISCGVILASCLIFTRFYDKITVLPKELYQNRRLIWKLSKNDFKKRYAGSYLGALWALAQPVMSRGHVLVLSLTGYLDKRADVGWWSRAALCVVFDQRALYPGFSSPRR